jgi:hypothetical protein
LLLSRLGNIAYGDVFTYGSVDWVKLNYVYSNVQAPQASLCLAVNCVASMVFGENDNWVESSVRQYLNSQFIPELIGNGANIGDFIPFISDLTADDGAIDYGSVVDTVSLMSTNIYRDNRAIIPCIYDWFWTLSPWSCSGSPCDVRIINTEGLINHCSSFAQSFGVRPLCFLRDETNVPHPINLSKAS